VEYVDFLIEIGSRTGRDYAVLARSPEGEVRATMRFPFTPQALQTRLLELETVLLRSAAGRRDARRKVLLPGEQSVQDFGRALFDALVDGDIRSHYDISRHQATTERKGLRLKLSILSPELAALPWELMYDSRAADYVALSQRTPVVRYLEQQQPIEPLDVTSPLRILAMTASPLDLSSLDIARERQLLEGAVESLRGKVELTWLAGQTWSDLQQALWTGEWNVFHFIGHGGFDTRADEGIIVLADPEGQSHHLGATLLGRLLGDSFSLRLVVLNSCKGAFSSSRDIFSSTAATLVRRGTPAVLAMQHEISDEAAIQFSQTFYGAVASGRPVDTAVTDARKAISMALVGGAEWATPVLFMRAPNGHIFKPTAAVPDPTAADRPETAQQPSQLEVAPADRVGDDRAEKTYTRLVEQSPPDETRPDEAQEPRASGSVAQDSIAAAPTALDEPSPHRFGAWPVWLRIASVAAGVVLLVGLLLVIGPALRPVEEPVSQPSEEAAQTSDLADLMIALQEQNDSGITGAAHLEEMSEGITRVTVRLEGDYSAAEAIKIYPGSCGNLESEPTYSLTDMTDGESITEVDAAFSSLIGAAHAIDVQALSEDGTPAALACGDITQPDG
jgi:hypothetical protein